MSDSPSGPELGVKAVRGRLLIVKEIADFLRTSERWVNSHMNDGTFPFDWYPIGDRLRAADSEDLNDWLQKIVIKAGAAQVPEKSVREIQKEVSA